MKIYKFFFLLVFISFSQIFAQNEGYNKQFELIIDNDIFAVFRDSDRYYSYGIGLNYSFKTENFFGLQNIFANKQSVFYTIGAKIEGYTPSMVEEFALTPEIEDRDDFDRPYAGLLYTTLAANYGFDRSFFKTELLLGIMGPSSQAGATQSWFHENITGDPVYDGWQFQLNDQFIFNFNNLFVYDFNPKFTKFHFYGGAKALLGNLYIRAAPFGGFRYGKYSAIRSSSGFDNELLLPKDETEFFVKFNVETRFVGYNATIQGNLFDTNSYGVDTLNNISWHLSSGLFYAKNRISLSFTYLWSNGVLNETENHGFGTIKAGYRF